MGMFLDSLLIADLLASRQARAEAKVATDTSSTATMQALEMKHRLEKLTLVCIALWSLIQEKTGLTEEDLLERVKKIDLIEGTTTGEVRKTPVECPKCHRMMAPHHLKCLYCGAPRQDATAWDSTL